MTVALQSLPPHLPLSVWIVLLCLSDEDTCGSTEIIQNVLWISRFLITPAEQLSYEVTQVPGMSTRYLWGPPFAQHSTEHVTPPCCGVCSVRGGAKGLLAAEKTAMGLALERPRSQSLQPGLPCYHCQGDESQ